MLLPKYRINQGERVSVEFAAKSKCEEFGEYSRFICEPDSFTVSKPKEPKAKRLSLWAVEEINNKEGHLLRNWRQVRAEYTTSPAVSGLTGTVPIEVRELFSYITASSRSFVCRHTP